MGPWQKLNCSNLRVVFQYLKSDFSKKKRSFLIGLISVFLVVFFICLLINVIEMSPVIFLRLCEDKAGETDVMIIPSQVQKDAKKENKNNPNFNNQLNLKILNFDEIHNSLMNETYIQGVVPRWVFQGNLTNLYNRWSLSNVIMLDSQLENRYSLGRNLKLNNLSLNECYVTDTIVKSLNMTLSDAHDNSDLDYINSNLDKLQNNQLTLTIKLGSLLKVLSNFDSQKMENYNIKGDDHKSSLNTSRKNSQENNDDNDNPILDDQIPYNKIKEKKNFFTESDLYEADNSFFTAEDQDEENDFAYQNLVAYSDEKDVRFNESNILELKNISQSLKENTKELEILRNIFFSLPLFNSLDFDIQSFFDIFSKSELFEQIMQEMGIPKIVHSRLSSEFAIKTIKNFLISNQKNNFLSEYIEYDTNNDEIKIKYFKLKSNEKIADELKNKLQVNSSLHDNIEIEKNFISEMNKIVEKYITKNSDNNNFANKNQEDHTKSKKNHSQIFSEITLKDLNEEINKIYLNFTKQYTDYNPSNRSHLNSSDKIDGYIKNMIDLIVEKNQNGDVKFNLTDSIRNSIKNIIDYQKTLNNKPIKDYKLFDNIGQIENFFSKAYNLNRSNIGDNNKKTNIANFTNSEANYEGNKDNFDLISISKKKVKINLRYLIQALSDDDLSDLTTFKVSLKVKNVVKTESGKWPSMLGNTIAIDSQNAKDYINYNLAEKLSILIKKYLNFEVKQETLLHNLQKTNNININEYTLSANVILKEKFDIYNNDENNQRRKLAKVTDKISYKLGLNYPIDTKLPLYEGFKLFNIIKIFLQNIFNSIIFFLWILSFMLVYSLILSNVDEKNYEFGMLRSLGFKKSNLIYVIILQSLFFSISAIFISLAFATLANIPISFFFTKFSGISTSFLLSKSSVMLGILAGLTLPLISSYFPVKKALSSNLKDSLSIFNKKINDISVNIIKLEKMGVSPSLTLASLILIIIGFLTYYLAPMSFLAMDFSRFLFILNSILIMMIIGLILIMQIFVPSIQKFFLKILMIFFKKDRNLEFIISKNLDGHYRRNQKSSIMFMIALGFIIFAGCTILLVCGNIIAVSKNFFGSDIWVGELDDNDSLDEKELVRYLTDYDSKFPNKIRNYTFISMDMEDYLQRRIYISTLNGWPSKKINLQGVDKRLISTGFNELYFYSEYDKRLNFSQVSSNPKLVDIVTGLFLNNNLSSINNQQKSNINISPIFPEEPIDSAKKDFPEIPIIIAEGLRHSYSMNLENPAIVSVTSLPDLKIKSKIIALAIKIPGLPTFSSYNTIANFAPVITNMETLKAIVEYLIKQDKGIYERVINHSAMYKTFDGIAKKYLLIQFYDDVEVKYKETVYYEIKNLMGPMAQSYFIEDFIQSSKKFTFASEIFFIVIGFVSVVLSFFLIMISFYSNIKDNICEYGILRAIGLDKKQSLRIYLFEASVIMLTSILLGTFIGVVISVTLILQFNLFSEIPFQMTFPFKLYIFMCVTGFVLSLAGSYFPVKNVNKLSLVKILKGHSEK